MGKTRPVWEEKIWGRVMHVFASPHAAVSYLCVEKDCYCSRHTHRDRANVFCSLSAMIEIQEWDAEGNETITLLDPGDSYEVPSGVLHRFSVIESGELIEIYYADRGGEVSLSDIDREDVGGRK